MSDYPRYTRIKEEMHKELQAKTGWGRNELETVLASVLNRVADEEISWLRMQQVFMASRDTEVPI